jgi:hypothetical protein
VSTTTVYVSIGNSDDQLTQHEWSGYAREVIELVRDLSEQVFGEWYSEPSSEYQNACIAAAVPEELLGELRRALTTIRTAFHQDSVAWAVAPETEFI